MKRITIIGTGYVGLVTGICFAKIGNQVCCLDIDEDKVVELRKGNVPFYEPGLEQILDEISSQNQITFTTSYKEAIQDADLCFLALPTPSNSDGSCDMRFVDAAAKALAKEMHKYLVVVNKSTVPVGTARRVQAIIEKETNQPFDLVSNPEFLREGTAVEDSLNPDRILLGVDSPRAKEIMEELYAPYDDRIQIMDIASSELSKYAANAMLATRLSFMNQLANFCECAGADIDHVRKAIGADPRIGIHYLMPGIGFGGSCLPKDVRALRSMMANFDLATHFYDAVLQINEEQASYFVEKIQAQLGGIREKTLCLWGLSFKPDTDDMREAPSLKLIEILRQQGASLRLYDPAAMPMAKSVLPDDPELIFCQDPLQAAQHSDAIVLLTEWEEFQKMDWDLLYTLVRSPYLFDGRNALVAEEIEAAGFSYFGIGTDSSKEMAFSR